MAQRPFLLHNEENLGRRVFRDLGARGGEFFRTLAVGRGLALGDLDNDGWPDLVVSNTNTPIVLLRNEGKETAPETNWLGIKLSGKGFRDVVGSTVVVETATRKLTRFAKGGGSYLSASDPRMLFGLGSEKTIRRVTVSWSWGETQSWEGLGVGAYYELKEGKSVPSKMKK